MTRYVWCVAPLAVLFAVPTAAQSLNATQGIRANVSGVLQVGPQVRPTTVVQSGKANIAGVMQVGANPSVAIRQSGRSNAAYVGQYENFFAGGRAAMP